MDKNGKGFPSYSKSYIKSKDFKIAGKSASRVNLTLSDEMLNAITLLSHSNGEIKIGFEKGDDRNNDVAEGNIKGTYGKKIPNPDKKRDFLGIRKSELDDILSKYPLEDKLKLTDAVAKFLAAQSGAEKIEAEKK